MATAICNPQSCLSSSSRSPIRRWCHFPSKSTFSGVRFLETVVSFPSEKRRPKPLRIANSSPASSSQSFDVIVVGAGIIGLTIARQLLLESDLSVAVVDAAVPCSGATGAGQGYIWMAPKTPGTDKWELSMQSHRLWNLLADSIQHQGGNPLEVMGWKKTGSMLVGRSLSDSVMLKKRINQLHEAGVRAEFLSSRDLLLKEPALFVGKEGGAAFLPDDCQLDARKTVAFILKTNRNFTSKGQYAEFYNNPVTGLQRSGCTGEVEAVQTSQYTLYSKKAIVVATGCWTGSLMNDLIRGSNIALNVPVKPRKGHLLVLENFDSLKVNHGLMEVGYIGHQTMHRSNVASEDHDPTLSVSMTATMDSMGNLVLGSSRQLAGFNTEIDETIINLIWKRAGEFFPSIQGISLADFSKSREVRVGLRPFMPDDKPVIGPVPGLSNVFLAAGHEGEGLSMALGTAEVLTDMVLGNPSKVDCAPFSVQGRCC